MSVKTEGPYAYSNSQCHALEYLKCALNCELRNTEQLISSLGMFAYECGSLKDCNAVLAEYGPDSMKGRDRVLVKAKPGQESGIERHNIQVVSFSGTPCI